MDCLETASSVRRPFLTFMYLSLGMKNILFMGMPVAII
jgi:hypothetical protein